MKNSVPGSGQGNSYLRSISSEFYIIYDDLIATVRYYAMAVHIDGYISSTYQGYTITEKGDIRR